MSENLERLQVLLHKYSSEACTKAEETELFALLNSSTETELEPLLTNILEQTEPSYDSKRKERILASVFQQANSAGIELETANRKGKVAGMWKRIAVAASIIGVLFFTGYWLINREKTDDPSNIAQGDKATDDVKPPDKNRAQITLADGRIVYLDSAGNGTLASQGSVKVVKSADGNVEYSRQSSVASRQLGYNTLYNPRGSKVQSLTLGDGTKVWLNAESSITYPIAFTGKDRKVTLTGEAYFEVSHDAAKPFYVSKGDMSVQVLGTHFNVNAYDDEVTIKVTLLEGSIRITQNAETRMLKPGEQARATDNNQLTISKGVDVEEVMAWKNGWFQFSSETVEDIMKEIARWYGVEVFYQEKPSKETFSGIVSRGSNVSQVLEIVKQGGVKFKIEGKKITVLK